MKKYLLVVTAALFVLNVTGLVGQEEDGSTQYQEAQNLVREAMKARYAAEAARIEALQKYDMAVSALKEVGALYPNWNPELVRRRIQECENALAELKGERRAAAVPKAPAPPAAAGVSKAPAPAFADADFVGHTTSKKLHRADCEWARKMASGNRVYFNTYEEAAAQGYSPCKVCKPDFAAGAVEIPPSPPPGSGPATTTDAPYIGHRGTKSVHIATCPYAKQMAPRNRVPFNSFKDAARAGYKPCKSCNAGLTAAPENGVSMEPAPANLPPESEYWASKKGKTFHRPRCEWAQKISADSLVKYSTREDAGTDGKKPCKICQP